MKNIFNWTNKIQQRQVWNNALFIVTGSDGFIFDFTFLMRSDIIDNYNKNNICGKTQRRQVLQKLLQ